MQGPTGSFKFTCGQCEYKKAEYYYVEDGNDFDSGYNYSCTHESRSTLINNIQTNCAMPAWCPLFCNSTYDNLISNIIDFARKVKET